MNAPTGARPQRLCLSGDVVLAGQDITGVLKPAGVSSLQAESKTAVRESLKNQVFIGSPYHPEVKTIDH